MLKSSPAYPITAQRLATIAAELQETLPTLKPRRVMVAEERLISARDARAATATKLAIALDEARRNERGGPSRPVVDLQVVQRENDELINRCKSELQRVREGFRLAVDAAAEPSLRAIDEALKEAATILLAASEVLRTAEDFRIRSGISAAPSRWRPSRDHRHLADIARGILG